MIDVLPGTLLGPAHVVRLCTALCIVTPVIFVKEMLSVEAAMKVISFLRRMTVKLEYHLAVMFLMSLMSHM